MAEKCLLCENYVVTDKCDVGEKGIEGLIKASIARKDGKLELFRGQKNIVIHASCRKKYTRPQSITRDLKIAVLYQQPSISSSTPCLRSSQLEFDFKSKCLLCAETIDDQFYSKEKRKHFNKQRKVFPVRTTKFDDSLLARAKERKDEWPFKLSRTSPLPVHPPPVSNF